MTQTGKGVPYPQSSDTFNPPSDFAALANWVDQAPGIRAYTTSARNALVGVDLWPGRVIFNSTTNRLEVNKTGAAGAGAWTALQDASVIEIDTAGRVYAEALDGGGAPLFVLDGDGSGRVGPYAWDDQGLPLATFGQIFKAGSQTVAFAGGAASVNHQMGSQPIFAAAAIATSTTVYVTFVKDIDATKIELVAKSTVDGSPIANGNYLVRWFGVWG